MNLLEEVIFVQVISLCVAAGGLGVWIYFVITHPNFRVISIAPIFYLLCIALFYIAVIVLEPEGGDPLFVMLSAALRLQAVVILACSPFVLLQTLREMQRGRL